MIFKFKKYIQTCFFMRFENSKIQTKLFTNGVDVRSDIRPYLVCPFCDPVNNYTYSIFWKIKRCAAHWARGIAPARPFPTVDALEMELVATRQGPGRTSERL